MFTVENNTLTISIDETIYNRSCILRTAYWFTDRCYLYLTYSRSGELQVQIQAKVPSLDQPTVEPLQAVAGEFMNALLDQQLRLEIEGQTGKVRELLVAKAFAEAGILEDPPPGTVADPVEERAALVSIRGTQPHAV